MTASKSNWRWWQRGVIYQIYPRSFMDANGDGVGDLQGVIDRLDYLNDGTVRSLGVDAIWLSPFYPSPMADFGYDIKDFTGVDPLFGTLEDFDRLVSEAHQRGMKIIVDYVPNHSSDEHPWFLESRSSRDNPKADWYIWRDAPEDGSLPNNWGSMFGGPAWTWDESRQQYYFHQFHRKQPDLNWRNPEVKAAMLDVLRFWLERGVDGFRMDVVYMIWKHPNMPDHPLIPGAAGRGRDDIHGRQEQLYAWNAPGIHDVMREIRAVLDDYGDTFSVGEIWLPLEERIHFYGANGDELHMPFNFDFINSPHFTDQAEWDAARFRQMVDAQENILPSFAWPNYVLGNHDVPRVASRFGQQQARTAAMMLLTLRGTPTIYMGEEIGMINGDIPPDRIQDPQGLILGPENSRDICRTPMQWDEAPHGGFSDVEPWLPVNADVGTRNVTAQDADPQSMLTLYRRLLHFRRRSMPLAVGSYESFDAGADIFAYIRQHEDERIMIILNFSSENRTVRFDGKGNIVISTHLDREESLNGSAELRPYEGLVVELA